MAFLLSPVSVSRETGLRTSLRAVSQGHGEERSTAWVSVSGIGYEVRVCVCVVCGVVASSLSRPSIAAESVLHAADYMYILSLLVDAGWLPRGSVCIITGTTLSLISRGLGSSSKLMPPGLTNVHPIQSIAFSSHPSPFLTCLCWAAV